MKRSNGSMLIFAAVLVLGALSYYVLTTPDRRSAGQKIGDAVDALPDGMNKASRELENRTPAEKLGDAAKDIGKDIKKATNQPR